MKIDFNLCNAENLKEDYKKFIAAKDWFIDVSLNRVEPEDHFQKHLDTFLDVRTLLEDLIFCVEQAENEKSES